MNSFLNIICFAALLAVIHSDVTAKSFTNVQKPHLKIVNGTDANVGEFPYMVQLLSNNVSSTCGGAIIGEKWILTTAQCTTLTAASIVYGTNFQHDHRAEGTVVKVKSSRMHPKFRYNITILGTVPLYDVGILELEENVTYSSTAQPIKLAKSDDVPLHVDGVVAGWGVNDIMSQHMQPYLQKTTLQLLNGTVCEDLFANLTGVDFFNPLHHLCSNDNGNGACAGDSGSPFVINGTLYGVTSFSLIPCGRYPGVYSHITNPEYLDFVKNVTGI